MITVNSPIRNKLANSYDHDSKWVKRDSVLGPDATVDDLRAERQNTHIGAVMDSGGTVSGPTEASLKTLFARSGNICAYPGCSLPIVEASGIITGEVCHIRARSPGGARFDPNLSPSARHRHENLILMCRRHHTIIDADPTTWTVEVLQGLKVTHEHAAGRQEIESDLLAAKLMMQDYRKIDANHNSGNIAIDSPGAVQANTIHLNAGKAKVTYSLPPGTIGSDQHLVRYIQHLIKRYNEFASADPSRGSRFHHGVISTNIRSKFGADWRLLPTERAVEVFEYLQGRIGKTRQARINRGKGFRAFSTFDEFNAKLAAGPRSGKITS